MQLGLMKALSWGEQRIRCSTSSEGLAHSLCNAKASGILVRNEWHSLLFPSRNSFQGDNTRSVLHTTVRKCPWRFMFYG
jgi:hypothetical protein